jgi:F-type H+-transporting ATPase subunit epsilon
MAIKAADIDEAKAEDARRRAEARMQEQISDEEMANVAASLAHSLAQLRVKRRNRSGG